MHCKRRSITLVLLPLKAAVSVPHSSTLSCDFGSNKLKHPFYPEIFLCLSALQRELQEKTTQLNVNRQKIERRHANSSLSKSSVCLITNNTYRSPYTFNMSAPLCSQWPWFAFFGVNSVFQIISLQNQIWDLEQARGGQRGLRPDMKILGKWLHIWLHVRLRKRIPCPSILHWHCCFLNKKKTSSVNHCEF